VVDDPRVMGLQRGQCTGKQAIVTCDFAGDRSGSRGGNAAESGAHPLAQRELVRRNDRFCDVTGKHEASRSCRHRAKELTPAKYHEFTNPMFWFPTI
jgi:hypothetical protein